MSRKWLNASSDLQCTYQKSLKKEKERCRNLISSRADGMKQKKHVIVVIASPNKLQQDLQPLYQLRKNDTQGMIAATLTLQQHKNKRKETPILTHLEQQLFLIWSRVHSSP
jgi:16S rRNA C1402 (ribose-2'-O) methylase RsmI